jgi:hypothetical protein
MVGLSVVQLAVMETTATQAVIDPQAHEQSVSRQIKKD